MKTSPFSRSYKEHLCVDFLCINCFYWLYQIRIVIEGSNLEYKVTLIAQIICLRNYLRKKKIQTLNFPNPLSPPSPFHLCRHPLILQQDNVCAAMVTPNSGVIKQNLIGRSSINGHGWRDWPIRSVHEHDLIQINDWPRARDQQIRNYNISIDGKSYPSCQEICKLTRVVQVQKDTGKRDLRQMNVTLFAENTLSYWAYEER